MASSSGSLGLASTEKTLSAPMPTDEGWKLVPPSLLRKTPAELAPR
jgi:hypothetical protein